MDLTMESPNNTQEASTNDIHHLLSIVLTTSLLAYLYLPRPLASLLTCPSFLSSLLLIFSLFRFGSSPSEPNPQPDINHSLPPPEPTQEKNFTPAGACWSLLSDHHCFNFARPLDVIYEEYEGEETESEDSMKENDSESSKDDDKIERWLEYLRDLSEEKDKEQEMEEDELIEFSFGEEEDNLIELDLSTYQLTI